MRYISEIHHRKSIRIPEYDYAQAGWYFVTICVKDREYLFGDIVDRIMILNKIGKIVFDEWNKSTEIRREIKLDEFVIMPNHIHGIFVINNQIVGAKNFSPLRKTITSKFASPSKTIGSIVRSFKIGVTKWSRNNTDIYNVWQRNYYEHVIRNENDLNRIREYIINNPINWQKDKYFK